MRSFVSSRWGLEKYQFTILPGIWAYVTDWMRKHGGSLLDGRTPSTEYELHRYSEKTRRSDGHKRRLVKRWNTSRKPVFERNRVANLQMLEELLRKVRERGVNVVLLELPLNKEIVKDAFVSSQRKYKIPVAKLADEYGYPYIDLNETVDIPSRDFQDLSHLIAPGRVIWQHALARELVPLLNAAESGGSGG